MATDGFTTSNRYILVLEDEPLILMDLEAQVQSWALGPTVGVSSEHEALEAIERLHIAVAIVDVHLRGNKSFDFTDLLLSRNIPVVLITGAAMETLPMAYQSLPLVAKPFDPAVLKATVSAALASSSSVASK